MGPLREGQNARYGVNKKSEEDTVEEDTISNVENAFKMQQDHLQLAVSLLESVESKFQASLEIPDGSMVAGMEASLNSLVDMKSSLSPLLSAKDDDLCKKACEVHSSLLHLAEEIASAYNDFEFFQSYLHSVLIVRREENVVPVPGSKKVPASSTKQESTSVLYKARQLPIVVHAKPDRCNERS